MEIVNLGKTPLASVDIEYIEIKDFDNFFKKMERGFEGCKLIYKKNIVFLNRNAIEYKVYCRDSIGTRRSILLPALGYSISLMGNEDDFPLLEGVLDHIELLEDQ